MQTLKILIILTEFELEEHNEVTICKNRTSLIEKLTSLGHKVEVIRVKKINFVKRIISTLS